MRLAGKAGIVTGAGRSIGRATATRFAAEGAALDIAVRAGCQGLRVALTGDDGLQDVAGRWPACQILVVGRVVPVVEGDVIEADAE